MENELSESRSTDYPSIENPWGFSSNKKAWQGGFQILLAFLMDHKCRVYLYGKLCDIGNCGETEDRCSLLLWERGISDLATVFNTVICIPTFHF